MESVDAKALLQASGMEPSGNPIEDELAAATSGCAIFTLNHRTLIEATGDDRAEFMQGMLSNDIKQLQEWQGCEAAFLTDSGKVVATPRVHCRADRLLLDCLVWRADILVTGLNKFLVADDVELGVAQDIAPLVSLEGPKAVELADRVFGGDHKGLASGSAVKAELGGVAVEVVRFSEIGGDGLTVFGPSESRQATVDACRTAGATVAGLDALQILRVEAGIAWAGVDMGEDTLLMEIGLDNAISRTKGCYLGQEVVERVSSRGQVQRTLQGFLIDAAIGSLEPLPMDVKTAAGATVGRVTSAVESSRLGGTLALGLLHRKGRSGDDLVVGPHPCRLVEFPGAGGPGHS